MNWKEGSCRKAGRNVSFDTVRSWHLDGQTLHASAWRATAGQLLGWWVAANRPSSCIDMAELPITLHVQPSNYYCLIPRSLLPADQLVEVPGCQGKVVPPGTRLDALLLSRKSLIYPWRFSFWQKRSQATRPAGVRSMSFAFARSSSAWIGCIGRLVSRFR